MRSTASWPTGPLPDFTPDALVQDSVFEDVDALFTDLDGDGDPDLVVAAGGNEYEKQQEPRLQRTYLNDGAGNFSRADVLPAIYATASRVVAADFDGDGLDDLFLGGRVVPKNYGLTPPSYLLRNQGDGSFVEVTDEVAPGLSDAGTGHRRRLGRRGRGRGCRSGTGPRMGGGDDLGQRQRPLLLPPGR